MKRGTQIIPDAANFDAVIKGEQEVSLTESSFNTQDGFIFAVYIKLALGELPVTFTIKPTFNHNHEIVGLRSSPYA